MSGSDPPEGRNPFEGLPLFGDLARMFTGQGSVNWDVARQIALVTATEGRPEPNVDPLERIRLEELVRVADLRVADATGLTTSQLGGVPAALPVTRAEWAVNSLQAFRPFLQRLGEAMAKANDAPETRPDPTTGLLGDLSRVVGPVLLGAQAGAMVGYLARRSLGQYDVPMPRPQADQILVVPANITALAEQWSLDADDVRLWVCFRELAHHAVMGRPHVRARLEALLNEYVDRFEVDPDALDSSLSELDPTDPSAFQRLFGSPEILMGVMRSPAQAEVLGRIESLLTAIVGFVDHAMDTAAHALIGSYDRITEAVRRQRVEASSADQFVERMLGFELGRKQYDRGAAFARGVADRAGDEGLQRLWESERTLPTPAELDAPGLWLARIDLPDD